MTAETRYLVTDGWDIFRLAESKKEAVELAKEEVDSCNTIEIYELKKIGCAYLPDPDPIVEWDE
jgi:hypothetical protein